MPTRYAEPKIKKPLAAPDPVVVGDYALSNEADGIVLRRSNGVTRPQAFSSDEARAVGKALIDFADTKDASE